MLCANKKGWSRHHEQVLSTFCNWYLRRVAESPQYIVLLLWNFNATVSDPTGIWKHFVRLLVPDLKNNNGNHLLQLFSTHQLVISNTNFKGSQIHQFTWYSNDGITKKYYLLYIIVSRQWMSSVSRCHLFRCADLDNTDNRLVVGKIHLKLKYLKAEQCVSMLNLHNLNAPVIKKWFAVEIMNRFHNQSQF